MTLQSWTPDKKYFLKMMIHCYITERVYDISGIVCKGKTVNLDGRETKWTVILLANLFLANVIIGFSTFVNP